MDKDILFSPLRRAALKGLPATVLMASAIGCADRNTSLDFPTCWSDPQIKTESFVLQKDGGKSTLSIDGVEFNYEKDQPPTVNITNGDGRVEVIKNNHLMLTDMDEGRVYELLIDSPQRNSDNRVTIDITATCALQLG